MPLQYVSIRFGGKGKPFTYHCDHVDPIQIGSQVEITTPHGARRLETVESVSVVKPSYNTKPATKV